MPAVGAEVAPQQPAPVPPQDVNGTTAGLPSVGSNSSLFATEALLTKSVPSFTQNVPDLPVPPVEQTPIVPTLPRPTFGALGSNEDSKNATQVSAASFLSLQPKSSALVESIGHIPPLPPVEHVAPPVLGQYGADVGPFGTSVTSLPPNPASIPPNSTPTPPLAPAARPPLEDPPVDLIPRLNALGLAANPGDAMAEGITHLSVQVRCVIACDL